MDTSSIFLLVAVAALLIWRFFRSHRSPAQLAAIADAIAGGAALVDVRSAGEFARGHLPGAINIPLGEDPTKRREIGAKRSIVLYCASGARSAMAASRLRRAGRDGVLDLGPMGNAHRLPDRSADAR